MHPFDLSINPAATRPSSTSKTDCWCMKLKSCPPRLSESEGGGRLKTIDCREENKDDKRVGITEGGGFFRSLETEFVGDSFRSDIHCASESAISEANGCIRGEGSGLVAKRSA